MKIATWNVNSMNVRLPHVLEWLDANRPDVLVLQEIKQLTEAFPAEALQEIGYASVANGQKPTTVLPLSAAVRQLTRCLSFRALRIRKRRVLAATIDGVRVVDLYIPNGQEVGSEKYDYKLNWLAALRNFLEDELTRHDKLVVLGDFNIAPADADVHDPEKWGEAILCSPLERKALTALLDLGLTDVFRQFEQAEKSFSWWDYRAAGFRRNAGLRIDLILSTDALTQCCTASYVDKEPRAWERPSDHAPVVAEFEC